MTRTTHEIELDVHGEQIPVQLEEPGPMTKIDISSDAFSIDLSGGGVRMDGNIDKHIEHLVGTVSDFPIDLLNELPQEAFQHLLNACSRVFAGNDPSTPLNEPHGSTEQDLRDQLDQLDLNDDGTLSGDDWR